MKTPQCYATRTPPALLMHNSVLLHPVLTSELLDRISRKLATVRRDSAISFWVHIHRNKNTTLQMGEIISWKRL